MSRMTIASGVLALWMAASAVDRFRAGARGGGESFAALIELALAAAFAVPRTRRAAALASSLIATLLLAGASLFPAAVLLRYLPGAPAERVGAWPLLPLVAAWGTLLLAAALSGEAAAHQAPSVRRDGGAAEVVS